MRYLSIWVLFENGHHFRFIPTFAG
jgi:hypothetical protein